MRVPQPTECRGSLKWIRGLIGGRPDLLEDGLRQAGELADALFVAGRTQPVADVGCPAVLPHDGASWRPQGLAVPQHDRLALVGDADGCEG